MKVVCKGKFTKFLEVPAPDDQMYVGLRKDIWPWSRSWIITGQQKIEHTT